MLVFLTRLTWLSLPRDCSQLLYCWSTQNTAKLPKLVVCVLATQKKFTSALLEATFVANLGRYFHPKEELPWQIPSLSLFSHPERPQPADLAQSQGSLGQHPQLVLPALSACRSFKCLLPSSTLALLFSQPSLGSSCVLCEEVCVRSVGWTLAVPHAGWGKTGRCNTLIRALIWSTPIDEAEKHLSHADPLSAQVVSPSQLLFHSRCC